MEDLIVRFWPQLVMFVLGVIQFVTLKTQVHFERERTKERIDVLKKVLLERLKAVEDAKKAIEIKQEALDSKLKVIESRQHSMENRQSTLETKQEALDSKLFEKMGEVEKALARIEGWLEAQLKRDVG